MFPYAASPDMPSRNERTQTVTGSRTVSPPSMNGDNVVTTSCVYIGSCEVPESQGVCVCVCVCVCESVCVCV